MAQKKIIKTCSTCGYKKGNKCMLSGYYHTVERQYPTVCGINFDNWIEKEPSLYVKMVRKIINWFSLPQNELTKSLSNDHDTK